MLEVCVDTVSAADAACAAGAGRIELCSALDVGGVTPCQSLIQAVRRRITCPLVVLIRPRTGDFVYDESEREQAVESIHIALGSGADGVVVGALTAHDQLDLPYLNTMRLAAGEYQLVMHRAFDFAQQPTLAIDQLVELGFDRILTSGGPSGHVMSHVESLRRIIECAQQRIEVMPGGGVNATNAAALIQACHCRQLHGSFRLPSAHIDASSLGTHRGVDTLAVGAISAMLAALHGASPNGVD